MMSLAWCNAETRHGSDVKISFVCSSILKIQVKSTRNIGFDYVYVGSTYFYMVYLASSTKVLSWHSGKFKRSKVQAGRFESSRVHYGKKSSKSKAGNCNNHNQARIA